MTQAMGRAPQPAGRLYVVATPIGNMEDITLRALRVLSEVAWIAAEDTRAAAHLLSHHRIRAGREAAKLISFFIGNEAARTGEILAALQAGHDVALISEAGLPGVSDPGQRLVAAARAAGIPVEVLPGACAALTALVGSGLPSDRFLFLGFLPRKEGERTAVLARLRDEPGTLIFYESPERVGDTLAAMVQVWGPDRPACVARELTKLYEEFVQAPLSELQARYADTPPRGEVTLLVGGNPRSNGLDLAGPAAAASIEQQIRDRVARGQSAKEISTALSLTTGLPRRKIYQLALALQPRDDSQQADGREGTA